MVKGGFWNLPAEQDALAFLWFRGHLGTCSIRGKNF
jgi:hypothetical protein